MAEFNAEEFFPNELLNRAGELGKLLLKDADAADKLHVKLVEVEKSLTSATTIQQVKKSTTELTLAEQELEKIQKQLLVANAKNNDEYIRQKTALDAANKSLKEKTALGDRDAKTVNAQNASYKILEAALVKNKNAYKELTTAEERNSKAGKELLKIIQSQDKELKDLGKTMGESQKNVGNYGSALEGLDGVTGGLIGNFQRLGKQLLSLATNPFFIVIAAAIGIFKALQSSVKAYYETTAEGEEMARKQGAAWEAFFITLKKGWALVGQSVSEAIGEDGAKGLITSFLSSFAPGLLGIFYATDEQAQKLAIQINKLMKDHLRDVVGDANTELQVNELLEKSKQKLLFTDEQRLTAIRQAKKLREDQMRGDIQLAEDDLAAQETRIRELGGQIAMEKVIDQVTGKVVERRKLISEYTDDEIMALHVEGEEQKKLADLQAARLKVESDAANQRRALNKIEIGLVQEIEKARVEAIRIQEDAERKNYSQRLEGSIKNSEDIIKYQRVSMEQEIAIQTSIGTERIELIKNQKKQENDIIHRAAEDRNKELAQIRAFGDLEKDPTMTSSQLIARQNKYLNQLILSDEAYLKDRDALNMKYDDLLINEKERISRSILAINIDQLKKESQAMASELDAQVQLIKDAAIKGKISKQQAEKEILDTQKKLSDDYIKIQIDEVSKTLELKNLSVDEQEKLEKQLYDLQVKYQDALFNQLKNRYEDEINLLTNIQNVFTELSGSIGNLFHSITEQRLQDIDRENKAAEKQHNDYQDRLDQELDDFIGTEEDKQAFERGIKKQKEADQKEFEAKQEQFDRRRLEAQRKAAIYDKAVSATQAAIATALAVIKALADPGGFAGAALSIAAGIAGAIQVAAILASPIPQFFEGGTAPGGPIIAGELGRELMISPTGKLSLTPNKATLMTNVPAGTEIIPSDETSAILANLALSGLRMGDIKSSEKDKSDVRELIKGIGKLEHTVRTKKEVHVNLSKQGAEIAMRHAENRIKFLNDFYK